MLIRRVVVVVIVVVVYRLKEWAIYPLDVPHMLHNHDLFFFLYKDRSHP